MQQLINKKINTMQKFLQKGFNENSITHLSLANGALNEIINILETKEAPKYSEVIVDKLGDSFEEYY